jgi:hypothetical protein
MALSHGAKEPLGVTSGLVLYLDAANARSYPKSGPTWFDRSGSGNNGSLVNGVGYNSANFGSLSFDGTNDYVTGLLIPLTDYTINIWLLRTGVYSGVFPTIIAFGTFNPGFYIDFNSNGQVSYNTTAIVGQPLFNTNTYIPINTWRNLCFTRSSSTISAYVNGSLIVSVTNSGATPTSASYIFNGDVAQGTPNSSTFWGGRISNSSIYNRALSASEIKQNYNALKGRYGLT